jgi:hypothetical protein
MPGGSSYHIGAPPLSIRETEVTGDNNRLYELSYRRRAPHDFSNSNLGTNHEKSVQEVSKHRVKLTGVLVRKLLGVRHAPRRNRTYNPVIKSRFLTASGMVTHAPGTTRKLG